MRKIFSLLLAVLWVQQLWAQYNPDNPADPDVYYNLTLEASPSAGGSVSPSSQLQVAEGMTVTLEAIANNGYRFVQWTMGTVVVSTDASFDYDMPASDVTLTAVFEWLPDNPGDPDATGYSHKIHLSASPAAGGYFKNSTLLVVEGETVEVWAYPNEGYRFSAWLLDSTVVSMENPTMITMGTTDMNLTASFVYAPTDPGDPDFKEPYAVLTDSNTVLTFYYDNQKAARGGMSVGPFGEQNYQTWQNESQGITKVIFDDSFASCTTLTSTAYWFSDCRNLQVITGFDKLNTTNVTDMSNMFYDCSGLTSLDLSSFNTANVTNMVGMFSGCSGLTSLDLSSFNTANVTDMSNMFYGCSSLTSLNLSSFNTIHVTDMWGMFAFCSGLTSLDLSNFNTANVIKMGGMFVRCSGLTSLDLSNFNTDNVWYMTSMFDGCSGLTSLDLSSFNTTDVTDMYYMFDGCSSLTSLDLSSFNTANVTNMSYMFQECSYLTTIFAGNDWSTESVISGDNMFNGCVNLVGGMGTVYDESHVDYTYAHIDGGTANPGYFTDKNAPVIIGEATFDGLVATVSGNRQLDEAFVEVGGRSEAAKTIAAIIWNKETALTDSLLQGITNPNLLVYVNRQELAPTIINNVVVNGVARNVVLTDTQTGNNNFYCPQAFRAEHISYRHYFQQETQPGVSRGWEGIALPFNVQTITHEHHGALHPFGTPEEGYPFWLRQLTPNGIVQAVRMIANRPYIISMPNSQAYHDEYNQSGWVTFAANDVTVPVTTTMVTALADSSIVMIPTMQRVEQATDVYAINRNQPYAGYPEGSIFVSNLREVRPFEAYTEHRSASPAPMFYPIDAWMDGGTGIDEMENELLTIDNAYNLNGQRVKTPRKGVYIVNGRKTVVK